MLASPMNAVDQILTAWMDGQDSTGMTNVGFEGKNGHDAGREVCS
jgi:hypothetical protein